jgi:glycosyltransferase involved in cell wall biosynthesis
MKILISTFSFPPNKDGVAEAASMMASGFLERGWEVEVATSTTTPPSSELVWHGARIHQFSITGTGHPKLPFRGNVSDYRAFLESGDWDIVVFHAYAWTLYLALGNLAKIRGRIILVSHGHNVLRWIRVAKFPWGLGSVFWAIYQTTRMCGWIFQFDRVVYLSKYADMSAFFDHSIAKRLGYRGRRVIPNGVNLEERATAPASFRDALGIMPDQIVFLCVANFNSIKNQGFAARSFRLAAIPGSILVFIGSQFNEFSKRFQNEDSLNCPGEHPGKIVWLEKQTHVATLNAFAACDAFVLSSESEAQPIALLEAMREAKPWIARKAGCIPEMPGGICVHTEEEMAKQMVHLANDQNLRAALGKRGRQAIEETYNRQHYIDAYCQLVSEVTGH